MVSSFQDEGVLSDIMLYAINHPKNPELLQMRANYFDANFIINEYISYYNFVRYKIETVLSGETVEKFCFRNGIPYNFFRNGIEIRVTK